MAPSALRSHLFAERGLAWHSTARRSHAALLGRDSASTTPVADASPSPSPTSGPPGISMPPLGTGAIVGITLMLSFFLSVFVAWRVYVYRKNKRTSVLLDKKKNIGLFDPAEDDEKSIKRTLSQSSVTPVFVALPKNPDAAVTRDDAGPQFRIGLTYTPEVIYEAPPTITISAPPVSKLQISPPPTYDKSIAPPMASPRTAASIKRQSLSSNKSLALPRLVIAVSTFKTSLHDELQISVGETLRLLEEYADEWCLVQRVGLREGEKGVVPRFCVADKPAASSRKSPPSLSTKS